MRHLHSGRKLGVGPDRRRALLRSLTLAILEKDAIQTTPARAKELRWYADHMVTLAKRGDVAGRRQIIRLLGSTQTTVPGQNRVRLALERLYTDLVPRFKDRNGGYTQIIRLAKRRAGDNAELCIMRYLPKAEDEKKASKGSAAKKAKETPKKAEKKAAPAQDEKAEAKAADKPTKKTKTKKDKEE